MFIDDFHYLLFLLDSGKEEASGTYLKYYKNFCNLLVFTSTYNKPPHEDFLSLGERLLNDKAIDQTVKTCTKRLLEAYLSMNAKSGFTVNS